MSMNKPYEKLRKEYFKQIERNLSTKRMRREKA